MLKLSIGLIIVGAFLDFLFGMYCGVRVTEQDLEEQRKFYERRLSREARW